MRMKKLIFATVLCVAIAAPALTLAQSTGGDAGPAAKPSPDAASPALPGPDAANPAAPNASPATPANPAPLKPGGVRITTRAPEPDKWDGRRSANGAQRIFKCKPLACSDAETVTIVFLKSPTRHPDPRALDKLAKVDLPKSIRAADAAREILTDGAEKIDTLSSKTSTLKTYPAVVNESRFTRANLAIYVDTAIIFAGPVMIRVQSASQNRDLAQKTLNDFIDVMKIEEGPPLPPGAPEPGNPMPATSGQQEQL